LALCVADAFSLPYNSLRYQSMKDIDIRIPKNLFCDRLGHDRMLVVQQLPKETVSLGLGPVLHKRRLNGYNAVEPKRLKDLFYALVRGREPPLRQQNLHFVLASPGWITERAAPFLDMLNVRYVAAVDCTIPWAEEDIAAGKGRFSRRQYGPITLYENHSSMPIAYVLHDARVMTAEDVLANLRMRTFDPRSMAVLEAPFDMAPLRKAEIDESVFLISYQPNRVYLEVDLSAPGFLVLTDAFFPGWYVSVNGGRFQEALCVNHILRGAYLTEGKQTVAFVFRPRSFRIGLFISVSTLLILVVLLIGILFMKQGRTVL
jgi:hypothetical protein